jgi:hypothetical protein
MKYWRLFFAILAIFIFERLLPFVSPFPVFIYPIFLVFYLLNSSKFSRDFMILFFVSIFFDLFSGYSFGYFTIAMVTMSGIIFYGKKQFMTNNHPVFSGISFIAIFILLYFGCILYLIPSMNLIDQLPILLISSFLVYFIMYFCIMLNQRLKLGHEFK